MNIQTRQKRIISLLLAAVLALGCLSACTSVATPTATPALTEEAGPKPVRRLTVVDQEPDTVDFQVTTIYYTVALNAFDRLVGMEVGPDGDARIVPSLAESWEISEDGTRYTFHLREGVSFANGSPLTASDVLYTMKRLLTHPDSGNADIAMGILGATRLHDGETNRLAGFEVLSELDFAITLSQPFSGFLSCLSMGGASILDEETTTLAASRFGVDPKWTVGTGSFQLESWEPGKGMLLVANPDCWEGAPAYDELYLRFLTDGEEERLLFENGELDILDLDNIGESAEFFFHGDIYQDKLYRAQRVGITYIALNESIRPLNNVKVRKALQLGLDRQMLLDAVYSGRGAVENGIFSRGLIGYNPDLPEIPYDPEQARALLEEAGYPNGFELEVSVKSSSTTWERRLITLVSNMWEQIGVRCTVNVMSESEFMSLRKSGKLACYSGTWLADYDDPDNFILPFFGSEENTVNRSLCYPRKDIMRRVYAARAITDEEARIAEYQELERIIIQEDAAWVPLFSRQHFFVVADRVETFEFSWNGWITTRFRYMALKD